MNTTAKAYGFIKAAFGPLAGCIADTLLWLASAPLACGGIAATLADVAVSVLPQQIMTPTHAAVIIGVIGGFAYYEFLILVEDGDCWQNVASFWIADDTTPTLAVEAIKTH